MKIEILGAGCDKCRQAAEVARQAVVRAKVEATVRKVEDLREILRYGVLMTPAVAVDGMVRVSGRVPTLEEMESILREGNGC